MMIWRRLTRMDGTLGFVGIALLALVVAGMALHVPGADGVGSPGRTNAFVALMAAAGAVYGAGVVMVLRRKLPGTAVWIVLAFALAMRIPPLLAPPFLSSDLFRYVWDGRVQLAGINPYRYIPADPALLPLRDAHIYPHVNRADYAPTVYPPVAEAIFRAISAISQTPLAEKSAMVGFELLAMAAVLRLLDLARLPRARLLIYAWNPLAVWSFAGNGHVDAAAIGFVALALLARGLRRDGLAGALLAGAILVKFLPAAITPALWRRWDWRLPAACAAVIVACYAFYADVGSGVLGFLPAYGEEEGLRGGGGGIWLLAGLERIDALPSNAAAVYYALTAAGLLAVAASITLRGRATADPAEDVVRFCRNSMVLSTAAVCVISPHYPWYFVWLAVPACLCPVRSVIFLSVAPLLLYLDPWHERFFWASFVYLPFAVLAVIDLRGRFAVQMSFRQGTLRRRS